MNPIHFLIALLAVVSVTGSLAFAALLTRPEAPAMMAPGAPPMSPGAPSTTGQRPDQATIVARVEALRERLVADPDDGEGWKMLGRSMMSLGRFGDAVTAYSRAAQLLPSDPEVRGALLQLEEKARESRAHEQPADDKPAQ
ncbi:MAG: tetratricopeptide repeat protein [Alphaproteobacteria bacterium]